MGRRSLHRESPMWIALVMAHLSSLDVETALSRPARAIPTALWCPGRFVPLDTKTERTSGGQQRNLKQQTCSGGFQLYSEPVSTIITSPCAVEDNDLLIWRGSMKLWCHRRDLATQTWGEAIGSVCQESRYYWKSSSIRSDVIPFCQQCCGCMQQSNSLEPYSSCWFNASCNAPNN